MKTCDVAMKQRCVMGQCLSPCEVAASSHSYIGCEYWPTTTVTAQLNPYFDFAVVVAVFSKWWARVLLPLVAIAHLVIVKVFGVIFLSAPLFLLFVDWDPLFAARPPGADAPSTAQDPPFFVDSGRGAR